MGMLARRTVSGSLKPFTQSHTFSNLIFFSLQQTTAKSWLYRRVFVAIFEILIKIPRRQFPLAVDCGNFCYLWPLFWVFVLWLRALIFNRAQFWVLAMFHCDFAAVSFPLEIHETSHSVRPGVFGLWLDFLADSFTLVNVIFVFIVYFIFWTAECAILIRTCGNTVSNRNAQMPLEPL